jgi:hypothetical protein
MEVSKVQGLFLFVNSQKGCSSFYCQNEKLRKLLIAGSVHGSNTCHRAYCTALPHIQVLLVIYIGAGKDVEPLEMACPTSRGQVINFSRKLVIPLMNPKHASKGCNRKGAKRYNA